MAATRDRYSRTTSSGPLRLLRGVALALELEFRMVRSGESPVRDNRRLAGEDSTAHQGPGIATNATIARQRALW